MDDVVSDGTGKEIAEGASKAVKSGVIVLLNSVMTDEPLPKNVNTNGLKTTTATYHL